MAASARALRSVRCGPNLDRMIMEPIELHDSPARNERPRALPRYLDVLQSCQAMVVDQFTQLFKQLFGQMDNFMLGLAENAETNAARNHCFEVMHEMLLRQANIERTFSNELARGFTNFASGKSEPLRRGEEKLKVDKLSLVEKEDYEISLAYTSVLHAANTDYSAQLFALNHRLAIVNGGVKLGEYNPALPGSPAQVCDALQTALDTLDIPVSHKIKIALIGQFDRQVLRQAQKIYDDFNDTLIKAGILPNLSLEAFGYKPAERRPAAAPGAPESQRPEETGKLDAEEAQSDADQDESSLDREIFQGIQDLLARRRSGTAAEASPTAQFQTNYPELLASLNQLQVRAPPFIERRAAHQTLNAVKEAFSEQLGRLAEIVREQHVNSADADIIDLVGMLFEFILNDNTLPDSVKALLSHLHTPILKVALLDKKFFFRSKHPARRLLNAMTQAGVLCNTGENEEQGIFAKMESIVSQILQNYDDNTELFSQLLDDFNTFLDNFNRRSRIIEKRVVETAKGRERLREARQAVSQEIVDRTWNRAIPKPAEDLLMGPWANLMVLTLLRNGQDSEEWKHSLAVLDDVLWSVEPKETEEERQQLRDKLTQLEDAIRSGLAMIGDPEVNTNCLLQELAACQQAALGDAPQEMTAMKPAASTASAESGVAGSGESSRTVIWDDVEVEPSQASEPPFVKQADPELLALIEQLKNIKLGAWFEFTDAEKNAKVRGKLSWYSPKTSFYIFVNQAGIQLAVKSLRTLAKEIQKGETRIVPPARKPLMDRALETIHSLLGKSGESAPEAWAGEDASLKT
jgi:hypothetical protein